MRRPLSLIKLKERSVLAARVLTVKKRRVERIEMTMLWCGLSSLLLMCIIVGGWFEKEFVKLVLESIGMVKIHHLLTNCTNA